MPEQQVPVAQPQGLRLTKMVKLAACTNCQAPGVYDHEPRIKAGWPGCHVELGDPRWHQPVGSICPNCGAARPADEDVSHLINEVAA